MQPRPAVVATNEAERAVVPPHPPLAALEAVIEQGLTTFVAVSEALLEIRDRRLYRKQYGTFEAYCQERWDISRSRAYRLMDAAEVVGTLSPIGDIPVNEAQARELVLLKDDPHGLREVWVEAQEAAWWAPDGG